MVIDKRTWQNQTWDFGLYKGCVAKVSYQAKLIFVFKDISPKRIKFGTSGMNDNINLKKEFKIIYISNKQLLDINFMSKYYYHFTLAREVISDGKIGTTYQSKTTSYSTSGGSYFDCVNPENIFIKPYMRRKRTKY